MTASFTNRATELSCWSAKVVSRSWSSGSKREWIAYSATGESCQILIHFDSLINHICDLGQGATHRIDCPARSVPTTARDGSR
jgi:hypothetical protein